jgi:Tol biopolymer transport system component/imidazolonepropionase-like amidohydrolase
MYMRTDTFLVIFFFFSILPLTSQEKKASWNVADPEGDWDFKEVSLKTDEGTWMNLDVSPDGKQLVFDLLGDIFIMPIKGGTAKLLRGGLPFEVQPRFSPDGKRISFTSDAGGGDNIWVMDADGQNAKQVTKESFRLLNNAVWTPDGQYLIARKHFTSQRSLGAGELWMYHITGGSGLQLTKRKNDQQDVNEPSLSPDGRYVYYSEDVYPGGYFQYNKDPNKQIYAIKRYDRETGKTKTVTGGPGGAARPEVSPDGKRLAFVRRVRTKSVLYLHDLETGLEWPVYDALNKDQQETWAIFGVYPNFSWMPDSRNMVLWAGGKIHRLDTETLEISEIPFQAETELKIAEALHFEIPVAPDQFEARVIRGAVTAPDGKMLAFNAAGQLWVKRLPDGKPRKLTQGTAFAFEPAFSPDGKDLVYVTWDDEAKGAIYTIPVRGGDPIRLTNEKGIFRTPAYSPDGSQITYRKEPGNGDQGRAFSKNTGIYIMDAGGGQVKKVVSEGEHPIFNHKGDRIIYQTGGTYFGNLTKSLKSVTLSGHDERTHIKTKYANRLVPSPDQRWIAFSHLHKVYLAPFPQSGKTVDLDNKSSFVPVSQVSKDAGINIHWSSDSQRIYWTLGNQYFENLVAERFTFMEQSPDSVPPVTEKGIKIGLELEADKPDGLLAFTGARIITMESEEVIEGGTIVINGNRIEAIGPDSEIEIPGGTTVLNASGKTIMPGIVDAHAHIQAFRHGLTPQKHWPLYANLAYGVTTAHDPSANSETVFGLAELVRSGKMVGPRIFSTGIILYGAEGDFKADINSLEDARSAIRRTKAYGAMSVKSYNQPRREQRQQIIQAAREEGVHVVPEGGSTFYHNMSMILDGHSGVEHNIPVAPVYKDVATLWGSSKTGYTPTLIVNYGGMNGEFFYYERDNVWENKKLLTFMPRGLVDARSRHRTKVPVEEYENGHILVSKTCKHLTDAGVAVNLGAHGQLQGLGAHWELWMLHQGGMTAMEALQAATINGATYIGAGTEIGSLKPGKLADLIVLDRNPLEDIENTNSVRYTMVNGRLYEANTMKEIGNSPKERTPFYWENGKNNQAFPWHESTQSFGIPACGCTVLKH